MKKSSWASVDPDPKLKKNPSVRVLTIVNKKNTNVVGSSRGLTSKAAPKPQTPPPTNVIPSLNALSIESNTSITAEQIVPTSQVVITNGAPVNRSQASFPALPSAKKPERISASKKPNKSQNFQAWNGNSSASIEYHEENAEEVKDQSSQSRKGKKKTVLMKFG